MSRDRTLEVRLYDHELEKIRERAAAAGVKVSEYVRARALGKKPQVASVVNSKARKGKRPPSIEGAKEEQPPVATRSPEENFVVYRTQQLIAAGRMPVVAKEEAKAEWRNRVRRGRV